MRTKAYHMTAYTAVLSAAGFLLRWLQNIRIIDPDTGLAERGRPISFLVAGIIVLAAASFALIAFSLRKKDAPARPELALTGQTFLHTAVSLLPALLLLAAGGMQLLGATSENFSQAQLPIRRVLGLVTLVAGIALAVLAAGMKNPERGSSRRVCSGLLILFGGVWLIAVYKNAASDPVVWRSAVQILAICAALLAFYHVAGYFYEQPSPRVSVFLCNTAAFLCVMSAIDDLPLSDSACFVGVALLLLIWSYTIVMNLGRTPAQEEPPAPDTEPRTAV